MGNPLDTLYVRSYFIINNFWRSRKIHFGILDECDFYVFKHVACICWYVTGLKYDIQYYLLVRTNRHQEQ